jgi:cytochrome o ubiquinol oxidase subunit II
MTFVNRTSIAIAILALPLAGCGGVLDPRGPVGVSTRLILIDSVAIMLVIVIPVIIATFVFAWWFRASNSHATYRPDWAFSGQLELIVWAIPALVITFLGGIAWFGSHALDPFRPLESKTPPIEIQVIALDWKWLFIYPNDGVASVNQLVVPVKTPLHFWLTSSGVMNSFFVPQLGSQIYTMAGMTSQLHLQADEVGDYRGLSVQFSGDGFSDMNFITHALPADGYAKWLADTKASGPALDMAAYAELAKQSIALEPTTYRDVDPKLFDAVVNLTAPPGEGPEEQSGGHGKSPASGRGS